MRRRQASRPSLFSTSYNVSYVALVGRATIETVLPALHRAQYYPTLPNTEWFSPCAVMVGDRTVLSGFDLGGEIRGGCPSGKVPSVYEKRRLIQRGK